MALREIGDRECMQLLGSRVVGRVAIVVHGLARVFPVNYLVDNGDIVFRTDSGTKLDAARAGDLVTFEVDDSDPLYHTGWSVMVSGPLHAITQPDELRRMHGLPLRAWGRAGEHWVRLPIMSISGRRINGGSAGA